MRVDRAHLDTSEKRELCRAQARLRRAKTLYSFQIEEAKRTIKKLHNRARKRKERVDSEQAGS